MPLKRCARLCSQAYKTSWNQWILTKTSASRNDSQLLICKTYNSACKEKKSETVTASLQKFGPEASATAKDLRPMKFNTTVLMRLSSMLSPKGGGFSGMTEAIDDLIDGHYKRPKNVKRLHHHHQESSTKGQLKWCPQSSYVHVTSSLLCSFLFSITCM